MKVEMITPSETKLIGEWDELPDGDVVAAVMPDFWAWFYSEDQGAIVAHCSDGPRILVSLPPRGPDDSGLYWDGPYKNVGEITDMWT